MALCLLGCQPAMAQTAPLQSCGELACGLYLQSTQGAQVQAPAASSNPTPLQPAGQAGQQPAAANLVLGDAGSKFLAGEQDTAAPVDPAAWLMVLAALIGVGLLLVAADGFGNEFGFTLRLLKIMKRMTVRRQKS